MKKSHVLGFIAVILIVGIAYVSSNTEPEAAPQPEGNVIEIIGEDAAKDKGVASEVIKPEDMLISYDLGIYDIDLKLEKNRLFEDSNKSTKLLQFNAQECGKAEDISYYEDLFRDFQGVISYQYGFTLKGDTQGVPTYWVTLHPNKRGYTTMEEFKKDFNVCNPNRAKFPYKLNEDWLMLVGSCGAPFDDQSGRPYGCDSVRPVIESTLDFAN